MYFFILYVEEVVTATNALLSHPKVGYAPHGSQSSDAFLEIC